MMNIGPSGEIYDPTVIPKPEATFRAAEDAEEIRVALENGDEKKFIDIVSNRSYQQRKQIAAEYTAIIGENLIDKLKSKFSGNFEKVCVALFRSPGLLMSKRLKRAMQGAGTDEKVLCQIIGCASNKEIAQIKDDYKAEYGKDLVDAIKGDVDRDFEKVLVALLQGRRNEPTEEELKRFKTKGIGALIDMDAAKEQANKLYQAGQGRVGTDEDTFISVICKQSVWQLAAIDVEYQKLSSCSIIDAIKNEFAGSIRDVLIIAARSCLDRPTLLAELIFKSLDGFGTDDDALISLIVARSSIDLGTIKQIYPSIAKGRSLLADVRSDTSGSYENILAAIIKE